MGGHIAHTDTHDRVVAHLYGQGYEHHHEGDSLLAHAEDGTEEAEHKHYKRDNDIIHSQTTHQAKTTQPLHTAKESHHADVDSMALIQYPERATDDEYKCYNVGLVDKPVEEGGKDLPCLRCTFHPMIRTIHHHLTTIDRLAQKLACGYKPGKHSRQHHKGKNNGEGVWNAFHLP